MYRLPLEN